MCVLYVCFGSKVNCTVMKGLGIVSNIANVSLKHTQIRYYTYIRTPSLIYHNVTSFK